MINFEIEVMPNPVIEQNGEPLIDRKRAPYQKISYQTKLDILTQFVDFARNPPLNEDGKVKSFHEFCHDIGETFNVQWPTVESLCRAYNRKNNLLTQLQIICSNKKDANKCGQILSRKPRLTYPQDLDLFLADWVYSCIDLGYILTRETIREKVKEVICPISKEFQGSDQWKARFLKRHHFSLRQLNEKSKTQVDALEGLSKKLKAAAQEVIKKYKIKDSSIISVDESVFFLGIHSKKSCCPDTL